MQRSQKVSAKVRGNGVGRLLPLWQGTDRRSPSAVRGPVLGLHNRRSRAAEKFNAQQCQAPYAEGMGMGEMGWGYLDGWM